MVMSWIKRWRCSARPKNLLC